MNVCDVHGSFGEPTDFHIGGSDASGIVYTVGDKVTNVKVGDRVVIHCGQWDVERRSARHRSDVPSELPDLGLRIELGHASRSSRRCRPTSACRNRRTCRGKRRRRTASSAAPRGGCSWAGRRTPCSEGDVVLVWGGSGGLGSMATQIVREQGGMPVTVVSSDEPRRVHQEARREGLHQPQGLLALRTHARLDGRRRVRRVVDRAAARSARRCGTSSASGARHASSSSTRDRTPSRRRSSSSTPAAWS